MKIKLKFSLAILFVFLTVTPSANATLIGDSVEIQRFFPDLATQIGSFGPFVVEAGPGDQQLDNTQDITFDVEASSLHIFFDPANGPIEWLPAAFNGWVFAGLDWVDDLTATINGVNVVSTVTGFTDDRVTFADHSVAVNMAGLMHTGGEINIQLATTHIPEPNLPALFVVGLLGLMSARKLGAS